MLVFPASRHCANQPSFSVYIWLTVHERLIGAHANHFRLLDGYITYLILDGDFLFASSTNGSINQYFASNCSFLRNFTGHTNVAACHCKDQGSQWIPV
jgi:hypothetical protein